MRRLRRRSRRAVSGIAADFADADDVRRLLDSLGAVDILVNNVGLFEVAPFADDHRMTTGRATST